MVFSETVLSYSTMFLDVLILPFRDGIEMLRADGCEIGDFDDLSTEAERRLGRLVRDKYATDFYVLDKYPLAVRPFYTMPEAPNASHSETVEDVSYNIIVLFFKIIYIQSFYYSLFDPFKFIVNKLTQKISKAYNLSSILLYRILQFFSPHFLNFLPYTLYIFFYIIIQFPPLPLCNPLIFSYINLQFSDKSCFNKG